MKAPILVGAAALLSGAGWLAWPAAPDALAPTPVQTLAPAATAGAQAAPAPGMQWMANVPQATPDTPAWVSMAEARRDGDPRTPPLQAAPPDASGPTPAQLADPDAYRAFEKGRDARMLAAYAAAVEAEVPRLRADVARARASGISPAEIAKVEAKIARLENLRRAIVEKGTVSE
jgi:hypothetical protein